MGLQFSFPEQTGPVAINTVGTLTINDGVVTGFNATSNYLQCAQKIDFTQSDYEIAVRVKPTSFSATTFLFSQGGLTLALGSGSDAGKVELYITLETSGYTAYKQLYTTTLNAIWSLIFKRTGGTKYEVFVANDSGIRTLIKTLNTSENITSGNESNILRWGGGNTFSQYLQGSLYLKGTYATVNGQLWAGQYYQTLEPLGLVIDDGTNQTNANYLIVNNKLVWANPNIYLQSSGTQYINTEVVPTQIYSYECTYLTTSTNNQVMLGQRSNGDFSSSTDQLYLNANTQNNVFQELIFRGQSSTTRTISTNVKYVSKFTDTRTNLSATTRPLSLMALNNKGTQAAFFVGKMYRLKIDNNGTLLRDFVPVPSGMTIGSYTTPSAGMFDIVNQQFYANSGSGTFTWGKDN